MEKESKFTRDADGYTAVRVIPQTESLPATDKDWMFGRDTNGNIAVRVIGAAGGSIGNFIRVSKVMPEASSEYANQVHIYTGETDSDFTRGHIYECVPGEPIYEGLIGFYPSKIGYDYSHNLISFFQEYGVEDPTQIKTGSFTYLKDGDIWEINGYDENGDEVFSDLKLYTPDLEDEGFVFLWPIEEYEDGEEINYEMNIRQTGNVCTWEELNS